MVRPDYTELKFSLEGSSKVPQKKTLSHNIQHIYNIAPFIIKYIGKMRVSTICGEIETQNMREN
jgi:hypothetical protein